MAKYVGLEVDQLRRIEADAGREPAVEAVFGRAAAGQGDAAGPPLMQASSSCRAISASPFAADPSAEPGRRQLRRAAWN